MGTRNSILTCQLIVGDVVVRVFLDVHLDEIPRPFKQLFALAAQMTQVQFPYPAWPAVLQSSQFSSETDITLRC